MNWRVISDEAARKQWDKYLFEFLDYNLYQSYSWGEYKKKSGWKPVRIACFDDNEKIISLAQVLYRSYYSFFSVLWCPGGPIGELSACGDSLRKKCFEAIKSRVTYMRIAIHRKADEEEVRGLMENNWRLRPQGLSSPLSMELNIGAGEDGVSKGFTRNWRRNLTRGEKQKLTVRRIEKNEAEQISAIYSEMEEYKKIDRQYSKKEIEWLTESFKNEITFMKCLEHGGKTIAVRGCINMNGKSWDIIAATNPEGRKRYASYLLFWKLISHCMGKKMETYNLSGVDPEKNIGVYNFKKGTGASLIEHAGEFDWSNVKWVCAIMNYIIRKRKNGI